MFLELTEAFGNFQPGDVIEVPDDTVAFDTSYLRPAPEGAKPKVKDAAPAPAEGAPLYPRKKDA